MRSLLAVFILFLGTISFCTAQQEIEKIVQKGIELHDNGKYDEAIATYKMALEIDENSVLANYEISLSYLSLEDYKSAIEYADKVIEQNTELILPAYLTKGSSLDLLGRTEESIQLFNEAIETLEPHHLIQFNLGINYFNIDSLSQAEENFTRAIELNPNHASSHMMLAHIYDMRAKPVQTALASSYFLFLEPNSNRSPDAFKMLSRSLSGKLSKDKDKPNTTLIQYDADDEDPFSAAELMISLMAAAGGLDEAKILTEEQKLFGNLTSLYTTVREIQVNDEVENWWSFYTVFLNDIAKSDHKDAFCNYITQSAFESSKKWLDGHEKEMMSFSEWLKNY